MLALQLEMRKGYDARWRFKPKSLGKEFDVFGVKMEHKAVRIHLIECTNDWDDELVPELEGKIALVEGNPKVILSEFRTPQTESLKVTGSILTTDALDPKLKRNQGPIAVIDRARLKADCRRYRVDWPDVLDKVFPAKEFVPTVTIGSLGDLKKLSGGVFRKD